MSLRGKVATRTTSRTAPALNARTSLPEDDTAAELQQLSGTAIAAAL